MNRAATTRSTLITDPRALEALRPEWDALLARSRDNAVTTSPAWMLAWWRVFGSQGDRALRTLAIRAGGSERLIGIAPFLSRSASYRPGIPLRSRRIELLASGEDEVDETCSDYIGIVADREYEAEVVEGVADAACADQLGPWDELLMPSMDGEGPMPALLRDALTRRGVGVELAERSPAPYVALPASWDAYLDALPPRRRYMVRRSIRDFEAWAKGPTRVVFARTNDELVRMQHVLYALHRERWAAEGKTGVFDSARFRAFHERVMPELLSKGALWAGTIEVNDEPIAAFYNVVWNQRACFYQSGRKLDLPRHLRPGIVMHAALIRAAIDAGLREYDFLGGASRYKLELATAQRRIVTLRAAKPSLAEAARRATEIALDQARRIRASLFVKPRRDHAA